MLVVINTYSRGKINDDYDDHDNDDDFDIDNISNNKKYEKNYGNIVIISFRLALKRMCEHIKGKKTEELHVTKH